MANLLDFLWFTKNKSNNTNDANDKNGEGETMEDQKKATNSKQQQQQHILESNLTKEESSLLSPFESPSLSPNGRSRRGLSSSSSLFESNVETPVLLNVYDLTPMNESGLWRFGIGLNHCGVEINGIEYSFASDVGIFGGTPKQAPGARLRETIYIGSFKGGERILMDVLFKMASPKGGYEIGTYHLLNKNCNHFADSLCWRLTRRRIPSHINRLPWLATCISFMIPHQLVKNSPVNSIQ
mmetsp:Transcript_15694/g.20500  ORF Transcript_15694/g.20500 Transcript_15694/m.20500 type:complete len:240 (-) Transcript_15694:246-965(-)